MVIDSEAKSDLAKWKDKKTKLDKVIYTCIISKYNIYALFLNIILAN